MTTLNDQSNIPILLQKPDHNEIHPVNYMQYMGDLVKRHRQIHPDPSLRSATNFAENVIESYIGGPVGRGKLGRAERGDLSVGFDIYAAIFSDMKIWPEIIQAMHYGLTPTVRYILFVQKELKREVDTIKSNSSVFVKAKEARDASR